MSKSVVITGASTGIGRACAIRCAESGFHVFAGVRKDADAQSLESENDNITAVRLDVTQPESIRQAAELVGEKTGEDGLQGLVNNAGIGVGGPLEAIPIDDLRKQFDVNVFGLVAATQTFLPLLRKGKGRVVNMSSIGGKIAQAFMGPYTASKHAVEALSDALRIELEPHGVRVSVVEPGAIATPIWDKAKDEADSQLGQLSDEMKERYGGAVAATKRRIDETAKNATPPERVADAVMHALTAGRPRTRYLVGSDAKVGAFLRWLLPDRAFYGMLRRM